MTCTSLLMSSSRPLPLARCLLVGVLTLGVWTPAVSAATLPFSFSETTVTGLSAPTAMAVAPDGRVFVCEKGGALRIVEPGGLLPTPFVSLAVNDEGERGLLGVALDPDFTANRYVYLYYTTASAPIHNRVSRFTADGNVAVPGSELPILDLDPLGQTNHNGGAIHFGPDRKLYVAVGENADHTKAPLLTSRLGKILRINSDGTIPSDNPFVGQTTGVNRAIWARGLRNPFTFAFDGNRSRMFINDVGAGTFEEINEGLAGANYGWPDSEGPTNLPGITAPRHAYGHDGTTCAITGGAFYFPALTTQFPGEYIGDYFFADLCAGWIDRLDLASGQVTRFATGIANPVDIQIGLDGSLLYLAFGSGTLGRVQFTNSSIFMPVPPVLSEPLTNGLSFQLSWARADKATSYILAVGTVEGANNVLVRDLGGVTSLEGVAPPGVYHVSVGGTNGIGTSPPSNSEKVTLVGSAVCAHPPAPPTGYRAQAAGLNVQLTWDKTFTATSYILEAGSVSGGADVLSTDVGNITSLATTGPPNTYFTRVRAVNQCGASAPSFEHRVTLTCNVPAPTNLVANKSGTIVTFTWGASPAATGYRAQIGSGPGLSNFLNVNLGPQTSVSVDSAGVAPGDYYVRFVATTTCGASGPSNEVIVRIP